MRRTEPEFNQALDSFALRATYISGLQQNGKYSAEQAYAMMKRDWKRIKALAKKKLKAYKVS